MTKAELIAAIAAAPDDTPVYIDTNDGCLRLSVTVHPADYVGDGWMIALSFVEDRNR